MFSFEINKVNSFPALTAIFPFIFLPSLSITLEVAFEAKLFNNPGKISLAKGKTIFVSISLPNALPRLFKLPNIPQRNPPD